MSTLTFSASLQQTGLYHYVSNVAHAAGQLISALFSIHSNESAQDGKNVPSAIMLNRMAAEVEGNMPSLATELRVIAARA